MQKYSVFCFRIEAIPDLNTPKMCMTTDTIASPPLTGNPVSVRSMLSCSVFFYYKTEEEGGGGGGQGERQGRWVGRKRRRARRWGRRRGRWRGKGRDRGRSSHFLTPEKIRSLILPTSTRFWGSEYQVL